MKIKRGILITLSALVVILVVAFSGYKFYMSDSQIKQRVMDAPVPVNCSVCEYQGKHAPCIVNLSTGEIGELQVYHPGPDEDGAISTRWDGGTFSFVYVMGLQSWRDSWTQTNHCDVPIKGDIINGEYFCMDCRSILVEAGLHGYVIIDCLEEGEFAAYPVANGEEYSIRGYDVTINFREDAKDELEVVTTGHYMDGMIPRD